MIMYFRGDILKNVIWTILYPYLLTMVFVLFFCTTRLFDFDYMIINEVVTAILIFIGFVGFVVLFYMLSRICKRQYNSIMSLNNNAYELSKFSILIKLCHIPIFIIFGILIFLFFNPFLLVVGIFLAIIMMICMFRSSNMCAKAISIKSDYYIGFSGNLINMLLFVPVLDVILSYVIYIKLK